MIKKKYFKSFVSDQATGKYINLATKKKIDKWKMELEQISEKSYVYIYIHEMENPI